MKIALLGYGAEAQSAYRYFIRLYPEAQFVIYDNAKTPKYAIPTNVVFNGGVADFHDIDADLVIKTPAIPPGNVSSRGKISSVTQVFFDVCPVPIIGVTGTKGKGTTATLISNILRRAGIKTWLVGNIGMPALNVIEDVIWQHEAGRQCVVVYELSSFQLWDLTKSPHIAVVLMIEPEHLNVHSDFSDYIQAKSNIVTHQTENDIVIYYADNEITAQIAQRSSGKKIPYVIEAGEAITVEGKTVVHRTDLALYGEHNVGNVRAAILAAWQFTQDTSIIREAVREFKGLPYRLEQVAVKKGVVFINDSFSSAPPATLAAASSFVQAKIMIMGGYDRGLDFRDVVERLIKRPKLKKVLLIGQTKHKIAQAFDTYKWREYEILDDNLNIAVERAAQLAEPGDVVILSPGCASFDMFHDFSERGDTFKKLVAAL